MGSIEIAAWVQALGSIAAIAAAIWISNRATRRSEHMFEETRRREEENRRIAAERHRQRILSGLYVEVFGRAARCARDADTWRQEVARERHRQQDVKVTPGRRTIMELLKFEPSKPVVYPALAESHGLLDPDAQAALSEFYYRLEAITRDINRFSRKPWDTTMEPAENLHLARAFHDSCEPAKQAIHYLRAGLDDHAALDLKLNASYDYMFQVPSPIGTNIDEVLERVTGYGRPTIMGVSEP